MTTTKQQQKILCNVGGPGTWLPRFVESFLSWALAVSCLGVSGYYYVLQRCTKETKEAQLMTHSRIEQQQANSTMRWDQLERYLEYCYRNQNSNRSAGDQVALAYIDDDDGLVHLIRTDDILRRLVSLCMSSSPAASQQSYQRRQDQLRRIWPRLLVLPLKMPTTTPTISLIVPCYRENMHHVMHHTLAFAASVCQNPEQIQLILIQADDESPNNKKEIELTLKQQGWGEVQSLVFADGTGRGPCLNYGAKAATGDILSFCHSDTKLPSRWDAILKETFGGQTTPPIACAFAFGIDDSSSGRLPPGIRAVEVTANLRCKLWSLPYGDQCLSIPKTTFEYVGGYPHQCIMEDYELIVLLRARGKIETLRARAMCSPRRWMKLGVLCVTYTNSYLVKHYKSGTSPVDIYNQYYGIGTMKVDSLSPWEVSLEQIISP